MKYMMQRTSRKFRVPRLCSPNIFLMGFPELYAVRDGEAQSPRAPPSPANGRGPGWGLLRLTGLHHVAGVQIGDRRLVVAELAQHVVGVLAEIGGRAELRRLRGAGHVDRLADD